MVQIETAAIESMLASNNAAMVFLDFAAAFPSIAHAFLFATLTAMGLPDFFVKAVFALYQNNIQSLRISGEVFIGFCVTAGVRQGCPLSGILFCICHQCPDLRPEHHSRGYGSALLQGVCR